MKLEEVYYFIQGKILDEGLRRVYNDKEVLQISEIVLGNRCIDLYVFHGVDEPKIVPMIEANIPLDGASGQGTPKKKAQQPKRRKLTPKKPLAIKEIPSLIGKKSSLSQQPSEYKKPENPSPLGTPKTYS